MSVFTGYPLYTASVAIYLAGLIASAGGIGGGGVVMPLLLALGHFSLHNAVRLSQCAVFGNSLAQCVINFHRSHPFEILRPLIYYDVILVTLPATLVGSYFGVMISKVFPETVILLLAMCTLCYAVYRTMLKGLLYYHSENESMLRKDSLNQKLLGHSLHSPTRIGRDTIFSEQVSVSLFDENGSGSGDEDAESDEYRRRSLNDNGDGSDEFARLIEDRHDNERSNPQRQQHSHRKPTTSSSSPGRRVNSTEYFRDSAIDDNRDANGEEGASSSLSARSQAIAQGPAKVLEWEQFAETLRSSRAGSQDTVIVNPATCSHSLATASSVKNVPNSLLLSAVRETLNDEREPDDGNGDDSEVDVEKDNVKQKGSPPSKSLFRSTVDTAQRSSSSRQHSEMVYRVLPTVPMTVSALVWLINVSLFLTQTYTAESCTLKYYLEMLAVIPVLFLIVVWALRYLKRTRFLLQGDVDFSHPTASTLIPLCGFAVGVLSSLLGIGGGELLGPLFLAFHMLPQVSTATSSAMSVLNSSSNMVHFIVLGDVSGTLALFFIAVGFAAGFTGRSLALFLSSKYNRVSILVFMLAVILTLSVLLLVYETAIKEVDFAFHAFC